MTANNGRRERIIQNILNKWADGFRVGIYGIEFCQVCGGLNAFQGWVGAVALHKNVKGKNEFVCFACIRSSPAAIVGGFDLGKAVDFANAFLGERPFRFCEVCGILVNIAVCDRYDVKIWACSGCEPKLTEEGFLGRLRKRRYLERTCHTDDQLRAFDFQMEAQRLDLEETLDGRLKSQRAKRAAAARQELGKVHGQNYERSP